MELSLEMARRGLETRVPSRSDNYRENMEAVVRTAMNLGAGTFPDIVRQCRGAPPTRVARILREGQCGPEFMSRKIACNHPTQRQAWDFGWPEESLAHFEWRFTPNTAADIAQHAAESGEPIVCIGAPTVFSALNNMKADVTLIDRNSTVTRFLAASSAGSVIESDIEELPGAVAGRLFRTVVMDGPWYPDDLEYWLSRALEISDERATIFLTLFPELVRETAADDRERLLCFMSAMGKTEVKLDSVRYETPRFEQEVFSAVGIPDLPDWRSGDLVRVQTFKSNCSLPYAEKQRSHEAWANFVFGKQAVNLRRRTETCARISIDPVLASGSFFLRTVSNVKRIRSVIDLWTSRNRVASVTGVERVAGFLRNLEAGECPDRLIEATAHDAQERQALQLLLAIMGW